LLYNQLILINKIDIIFLCGGKGTRLRPYTKNLPKPLLLVNKKPFLSHLINKVIKLRNVDKIILAGGFKVQKIRDFVKKEFKNNKKIIVINSGEVDIIKRICDQKNILLIEDCAEAIGQKIFNKKCGSFGHISVFSFYANKQITTGEGGMITTNSKLFEKKARSLRNLSFGVKNRFNHTDVAWNYRLTNIQASLGLSQLQRVNTIIKKRHRVGKLYYEKLKNNKNIFMPSPKNKFSKNIYWVIAILILNKNLKIDNIKAAKKLRKFGIETRPFFWPMHKQKVLKNYDFYNSDKYKNSDYISKYGFYLPSSLNLTVSEIGYVCRKVNQIFK
jgi:perosamine synthetase